MNPDSFAILSQQRRPWVDPDSLKELFLERSALSHPDRFHEAGESEKTVAHERYTALNTAFTLLKEPRDRLLHLYELEAEAKPKDIQKIPPGTMDLFVEIGQACRDVDAFLAQKAQPASPLVKVQRFQQGHQWVQTLQRLQSSVTAKRDEVFNELKTLNTVWEQADSIPQSERKHRLPLDRLEQLYRTLSYVARWTEQIQQRISDLI